MNDCDAKALVIEKKLFQSARREGLKGVGQTFSQTGYCQEFRATLGGESKMTDSPEAEVGMHEDETPRSDKSDGSLRILLVEDSAVNQRVATLQIQKLGHSVDLATNGKEAVEAVAAATYDMVLMDCHMPEMDGYDATAEIRRSEGESKRIPIIAMTAGSMARDKAMCIQAGMDDYISKPLNTKALSELIERWSEMRQNLSEVSEGSLAK